MHHSEGYFLYIIPMLLILMIVILMMNECCLLRLLLHMVLIIFFSAFLQNNLSSNMAASAVLRIILGQNDSSKISLPLGIPDSVEELKSEITRQCEVSGDFRLQYKDIDFDEFINLKSTSDIQNKATLKVIYLPSALSPTSPCPSSVEPSLDETASFSSVDTDILSSSSSSSSSLRCEPWPDVFPVPEFVYDVELQLQRTNTDFLNNGIPFQSKSKNEVRHS